MYGIFKIKTIDTPIFCNNNDLKSNIASKGYILKKNPKTPKPNKFKKQINI